MSSLVLTARTSTLRRPSVELPRQATDSLFRPETTKAARRTGWAAFLSALLKALAAPGV